MSDQSYDSVLVGYCEEPRMYEGTLSSWSVKFKATERKEMIEKLKNLLCKILKEGENGMMLPITAFSYTGIMMRKPLKLKYSRLNFKTSVKTVLSLILLGNQNLALSYQTNR